MSDDRRALTRAELPEEFTPNTIRRLPLAQLRQLANPDNGVLGPEEQAAFDAALREVMSGTARRVSRQLNRSDLSTALREARGKEGRSGGPGRPSRVDQRLRRLTQEIDQQFDLAQALAPDVDWSFALPAGGGGAATDTDAGTRTPSGSADATEPTGKTGDADAAATTGGETETVADLEQRLTEQVELVEVMSEIADMSKRTYALEQQRDLQNTRTVFFGFVVSVAVLVAGWAPIVAADDWSERWWIVSLTLGTCVLAGVVYASVRRWQGRRDRAADGDGEQPAA